MNMLGHATNPPSPTLEIIINNGFWPDIDPNDFREEERVSGITPPRIRQSLRAAVADVNRQLANYQHAHQQAGRMACDAIPPEPWQSPGDIQLLYLRAVYAQAQADLLERYRDASATGKGDERGEAKDLAADDYRADARWAIAELVGRSHTTVELI
ncbi:MULTISPECIES: head completion/stabilization protein [unclassified Halomonas]|uniref:head completion/stabilization protein n=1 Tax=unclassified Halomonas TaxID=2609666 RepID=UPI001CF43AD0|nr:MULTISPECIES: head completion/stabilization protein [unclassified Halomonas]MCA8865621.1 head completion/stabilization protein [Halomonas sp. SBBP1]UZH10478.1 head completion/stabilization protein [Halomonas sp. BDJS001]